MKSTFCFLLYILRLAIHGDFNLKLFCKNCHRCQYTVYIYKDVRDRIRDITGYVNV